jgi:formylglycine-generating enzyme required for sulfatase activity
VTCPVEKSGRNDWGLFGLGGNVWEWTDERDGRFHLYRGHCWAVDGPDYMTCGYRAKGEPDGRSHSVGFRLVLMR